MGASGLRLDLHNHTAFSPDGLMSPAELLAAAKARGLSCIAITDHNTIRGALQGVALAESDPTLPRVIPGVELSTRDGEVIGLYLSEEIPSRLTVVEAVVRIRAQGGLVCLPHPYDVLRRGTISRRELVRRRRTGRHHRGGQRPLAGSVVRHEGAGVGPAAGEARGSGQRRSPDGGSGVGLRRGRCSAHSGHLALSCRERVRGARSHSPGIRAQLGVPGVVARDAGPAQTHRHRGGDDRGDGHLQAGRFGRNGAEAPGSTASSAPITAASIRAI